MNNIDQKPDEDLQEIEEASDQSEKEIELCAYIKGKVDEVKQSGSRIAYEAIWLTNVAYILGFSGIAYDPVLRVFKNNDMPFGGSGFMRKTRMRVNKILPTIQNRLARLCKSPPRYDVRPKSNSTEDKDASRLGLQIIEDIFDKCHFDEKRQELLMTCQQYGYAFVQTVWDPCLGKPMLNEMGELDGYEGDIRLEILNPFEVYTDPLAKRMDDCSWWIKARVKKLSYFVERYPERGKLVKAGDAWLMSSQYEQRINSLTPAGVTGSNLATQMKNAAIELVYYEKKSKDYPNGRMVVTDGCVLLEDKELPIGEFDVTKFDDIVVAGKFASESIVTHLRPIQDQYNMVISKRAEWVRKLLAGKYAIVRGAELANEALNDSTEVLEYDVVPNAPNGGAPIAMNIPQIPAYAYNEEERLDKQFDFVSGINEISRGVLPSASIPAAGMQFLQEQDETRIGVQTTRNENGYARIGQFILMYAHKFYKMPRILKVAGDGLQYTVKEFVGADLKDNYDVIVIPGSTIPGSKVLRRQEIINAFQMGLFGSPQDPKVTQKVMKMLEFGDTPEIWKTQALDDAQVKKTIDFIKEGKMPPLEELDNHMLFIQELNDFRKSDDFDQMDEEKQTLLKYVIEWHVQAQVRIQNPGLPQQQQLAEHMMTALHQMPPPGADAQGNPVAMPPQGPPMPQQVPLQQPPGAGAPAPMGAA